MEPYTNQKQIKTVQTLPTVPDEKPIDCDFILPDYLPEIAAVLKCIVKPIVQSHQISGDRVTVDGMTTLQLLYLDEERKCVRSYETTQPFSSNFTLKDPALNGHIDLSVKVNYVNCRPTAPRRVEVHGAFQVMLTQSVEKLCAVLEAVEDGRLISKQDTVTYSIPCVDAEKTFTINEIVEIQNGRSAESVLRTETTPIIGECKCLVGKAIIKGELIVKSMLITDNQSGTLLCSVNRIPFSQLLDADGLTEETLVSCDAAVLYCETHLTQNPVGENTLLSVSAKLKLSLQGYQTQTTCVLTDAYHTVYPIKAEYEQVVSATICGFSSDSIIVPLTVELPDGGVNSVEDCWCDILSVTDRDDEQAGTEVCATLCILAKDSQNYFSYYERQADFFLPFDGNEPCEKTTIAVEDCSGTLSGNRVDVRLNVIAKRKQVTEKSCRVLRDLSLDDKNPFADTDALQCPLKVYFACAGETLWDIAKSQHIAVDRLSRENDLCCEVLASDTPLIVTVV